MLRLLFEKRLDEDKLKRETRVVPLLRANRVREACALAERRLLVRGFPVVRAGYTDDVDGRRLAASLMIPIGDAVRAAEFAGVLRKEDRD